MESRESDQSPIDLETQIAVVGWALDSLLLVLLKEHDVGDAANNSKAKNHVEYNHSGPRSFIIVRSRGRLLGGVPPKLQQAQRASVHGTTPMLAKLSTCEGRAAVPPARRGW